jgi:hypothetical protein
MMLGLYGLLCLALGIAIGAFIGAKFARRRDVAPAPVDLSGVDYTGLKTPENGVYRHVTICGADWEVRTPCGIITQDT